MQCLYLLFCVSFQKGLRWDVAVFAYILVYASVGGWILFLLSAHVKWGFISHRKVSTGVLDSAKVSGSGR
jgi:hypothetical protein